MDASIALPGFILNLAAFILYLLATLSTPIIKSIYLLRIELTRTRATSYVLGAIHLGTFGFCSDVALSGSSSTGIPNYCSPAKYPYDPYLPPSVPAGLAGAYNQAFKIGAMKTAIRAAIILPILCGFVFINLIFSGLAWSDRSRGFQICAFFMTLISWILSWIAFIILAVMAGVANNRLRDATNDYVKIHMANGSWMVLAGAIILTFATCLTCVGIFGTFRTKRS